MLNQIYRICNTMDEYFDKGELAYLLLTSKIELPFRDKLAFQLQKKNKNLFISREWSNGKGKKIDIAILDKEKIPLVLIELTAMYTFDAGYRVMKKGYKKKLLETDLEKMKGVSKQKNNFLILLATDPTLNPKDKEKDVFFKNKNGKIDDVIKYANRKSLFRDNFDKCKENVETWIKEESNLEYLTTENPIYCGKAFEIPIKLFFWIIYKKN